MTQICSDQIPLDQWVGLEQEEKSQDSQMKRGSPSNWLEKRSQKGTYTFECFSIYALRIDSYAFR